MHLFPTRSSGFGLHHFAALLASALLTATLTGCSAGQQSQTAAQEPAVNGSSGGVADIALRDVRMRATQEGDALDTGKPVDLLFVASNQSPDKAYRLVAITTVIGQVTISPKNPEIPASRALMVGIPDGPEGKAAAEYAALAADKATATVALTDAAVRSGLTYDFTFTFEKSSDSSRVQTTVRVPIAAGHDVTPEPGG